MIPAKELKAWVDRLVERAGDAAFVAVDAGGLTLVSANEHGRDHGYITVGGIPLHADELEYTEADEEVDEEEQDDVLARGPDGAWRRV